MASSEKEPELYGNRNETNVYDNMGPPSYDAVAGGGDMNDIVDVVDEKQMQEWREELAKVEEEIITLRQVLSVKVRHAAELKRKLGITPFQEIKQDFNAGVAEIKRSTPYQKTNETFHAVSQKIHDSTAYQKTSYALNTFSTTVSKKLGDIRNSQTFKSLEEGVERTYANVKTSRSIENLKERLAKVSGSRSENSMADLDENAATEMRAASPSTDGSSTEIPLTK